MEEAIRERVRFEASNRVHRSLSGARNHVVPLEELVSDDSVDEPSEAESEHDARPSNTAVLSCPCNPLTLSYGHEEADAAPSASRKRLRPGNPSRVAANPF